MFRVRWAGMGMGLWAVASLGNVLGDITGSPVLANPTREPAPLTQPSSPQINSPDQLQNQINSIRQLRDVSPQDWSYDALRNLVENYGCIQGYPDRTYRGDRPLTRNEFAAGLSACLQQLERRLLEARSTAAPSAATPSTPIDPLNDMLKRAFFNSTGTYFDSTNISGQANAIFGWREFPGSYFENQITSDAQLVGVIYTDAMHQQSAGKIVRTRDLTNPFDTSLQQNPDFLRTEGASSGSWQGSPW